MPAASQLNEGERLYLHHAPRPRLEWCAACAGCAGCGGAGGRCAASVAPGWAREHLVRVGLLDGLGEGSRLREDGLGRLHPNQVGVRRVGLRPTHAHARCRGVSDAHGLHWDRGARCVRGSGAGLGARHAELDALVEAIVALARAGRVPVEVGDLVLAAEERGRLRPHRGERGVRREERVPPDEAARARTVGEGAGAESAAATEHGTTIQGGLGGGGRAASGVGHRRPHWSREGSVCSTPIEPNFCMRGTLPLRSRRYSSALCTALGKVSSFAPSTCHARERVHVMRMQAMPARACHAHTFAPSSHSSESASTSASDAPSARALASTGGAGARAHTVSGKRVRAWHVRTVHARGCVLSPWRGPR